MSERLEAKINITGRVQGVGFRPFIYKLAQKMNINGSVENTTEGVIIRVKTTEKIMFVFCSCGTDFQF